MMTATMNDRFTKPRAAGSQSFEAFSDNSQSTGISSNSSVDVFPSGSRVSLKMSSNVMDTNSELGATIKTETKPVSEAQSSVFYFESDHVALKGNPDYCTLLKTVVMLQAQRMKAIEDLDKLIESQKMAMDDPIAFVHKLQNKMDVGIPTHQTIAEIPDIGWEKYTSNLDSINKLRQSRHATRHSKKKGKDPGSKLSVSENIGISTEATSISTLNANSQPVFVRGRVKDESKSETFNQPWPEEEHRRLEELLITYPPEEVEARRWKKIADALGNRTPQQVASRVQKYFIKLAKMGLPVPGRIPNLGSTSRRNMNKLAHIHQRNNRFLFPSSTFLASYEPPVYIGEGDAEIEGDSIPGYSFADCTGSNMQYALDEDVSDEEDVSAELRMLPEYTQILQMKSLRQLKLQNLRHEGYKCDRCGCEPIMGIRWHCNDCPAEQSVDFCDNCADFVYENGSHEKTHKLSKGHNAESTTTATTGHMDRDRDRDYTNFLPGADYNYLDPNYMPAS